MIIDAHHHLWRYDAREYDWIGDDMSVLRRDFLPSDLETEIRAAGVDGTVAVQARQTVEETRWLLEIAARDGNIRGVVGWVPLVDPNVERDLERFADGSPKLRGVRHVLQGEPDDRYMLRDDFRRGIALLEKFGLCYDILVFERHLPPARELVDRHPNQTFVLDHVAKPRIKSGEIEPWRRDLIELARRPNVFCKLSGMVTEADWLRWTPAALQPYADVVLEAFGPRRVMFGSDWPVCLLACPYREWLDVVRSWIAPLSPDERARMLAGTAIEAYGLTREAP